MDLKPKYRVIIAGGREFNDMVLLRQKCDAILKEKMLTHDVIIICGLARGADTLGEQYGKERGFGVEYFPANWTLGKVAGHIRNAQMLDVADAVIVFWDGQSRGSKNMADITKEKGTPLRVIRY